MEIHSEIWFREIFDRNYVHLRNYLYYLSGDISWSEDAAQEAFLILWEKREKVNDPTLVQFLFTVSRNIFLKKKRHEEVRLKFDKVRPDPDPENSADSWLEYDEFDLQLQNALSGLQGKCRSVFLMSRMDEMSNKEIALALDISEKAVENQITKALKFMRQKLEKFE